MTACGHLVRIPRQIKRPPRRKLIQNEPINAEIKNAVPAQSMGRHSTRLQNIKTPPSATVYAAKGGWYVSFRIEN